MREMNNILIIGAHYDDTELGVGGTAAKLAEKGKNVYKLTLTDNVTQFEENNVYIDYKSSSEQSSRACKILGIKEITSFHQRPCSELRYSTELMHEIEQIIFQYKIDTVFSHFGNDMNQDHVEAARLSVTAARHCKNILMYQSNGYILNSKFYPTFFVDISMFLEKKRQALNCYGSEHNRFHRLFENCIEKNHIWGYANEVDYAEGFHIVKMLE